jgi:hypothetical protein
MPEATLCDEHYAMDFARKCAEVWARGAEDVLLPVTWEESTGNDVVQCIECLLESDEALKKIEADFKEED